MSIKNNLIIRKTSDGSETLYSSAFDETYHSIYGAINEALHIFINAGFNYLQKKNLSVFELGFGTGLNAFLSFLQTQKTQKKVKYLTIEKFPVDINILCDFNKDILSGESDVFFKMHKSDFNKVIKFSDNFIFTKQKIDFKNYKFNQNFDLIYYDAFSYEKQPQMWKLEVFEKVYKALNHKGILVTFSSKGIVKQNLRKAGFKVQRLKGFKKRHIIRALKE